MDQMVTDVGAASRLIDAFDAVRARTEAYCRDLSPEDQCLQSMEDASPAKWHRAHTTWFFERFILRERVAAYRSFNEDFDFLFNSYYVSLGERQPRPMRGLVTRPDVAVVGAYRHAVDDAMRALLSHPDHAIETLLRLGVAHEEQHQELLLTDILHGLSMNPLAWASGRGGPIAVLPGWTEPATDARPRGLVEHAGGIVAVGTDAADGGFAFDNEGPRHNVLLQPHALDTHLIRNGAFLAFIADGGYRRPELWMSDGWSRRQAEGWEAPLYWRAVDGARVEWTLGGCVPLDLDGPVRHVSWYEADAFARWAGARLPTEFELEASAPMLAEFDGHVWQWSNSAYLPYPGFRPDAGAIGEYNGKFMINQMVLRGSSLATSPGHSRPSYRNFFPTEKRWQVTGLRLAHDR